MYQTHKNLHKMWYVFYLMCTSFMQSKKLNFRKYIQKLTIFTFNND